MAAGIGGNPAAGGWVSGMINKGAGGYSPQGKGYGSTPMPGIFGMLFNGGAFASKPGQQGWLQKFAASVREDGARISQAGNSQMQQAIAAASQMLQQSGVREASAAEVYGAPGTGGGRGGFQLG